MARASVFIVSAPSGAGKTSLLKAFLKDTNFKDRNLGNRNFKNTGAAFILSVSHTTRQPRQNEVNGEAYHFVTKEVFQALIDQQQMLEYAEVFGHWYGTAKPWLEQQLNKGLNVILEIDVQGALQVMQKIPESHSLFIFPPSLAALKQRLIDRNSETPHSLETRLIGAKQEIRQASKFNYWLVNEDFQQALEQLSHFLLNPTQCDKQTLILSDEFCRLIEEG